MPVLLKWALAGIDDTLGGAASAVRRPHANTLEASYATDTRHITFASIVNTETEECYFSPAYGFDRIERRAPAL
jgi:hypothetical protein